ncbi:MAG TPA: outer membrane beta-barrel protein [Xanthobacteraceae bacterium]|nr:outer membrane beta-barrel protein [Xanthobacteraceae bacterium]
MSRLWLAAAALLAMIAGPAFAADMPLKAPPMVAPTLGWSGWYVGAEFGAQRSKSDWTPTCIQFGGPFTCANPLNALIFFPGAPDSAASFSGTTGRYGIYYGWMYQANDRWVFGAESDYAFHHQTGSVPFIVGCATAACTGGAFGAGPFTGDSSTLRIGNDYSFRLRAGFLVIPDLQLYVAGGPAVERVQATMTCSVTGAAGCFPTTTQTATKNMVGYTVGAGLEWKVWEHILLRGEYRYADYGTWKQNAFVGTGIGIEEFANIHVKSNTVTFGIAYLFPPPRW